MSLKRCQTEEKNRRDVFLRSDAFLSLFFKILVLGLLIFKLLKFSDFDFKFLIFKILFFSEIAIQNFNITPEFQGVRGLFFLSVWYTIVSPQSFLWGALEIAQRKNLFFIYLLYSLTFNVYFWLPLIIFAAATYIFGM